MDTRCRKCGEPFDIDEFHAIAREIGGTFKTVERAFRNRGCEGIGYSHSDTVAHPAIGALADLLGDDIDGLAAMLEDFGL